MCYVYVLCSLKNNRYYIGSTNNLKRRLAEHNRGESLSLRNKGPFKLVYCEEYAAKRDAILREK
ncbi:MAG: GIY-YIG nuclease family protein, partial [Candidatus Omnitrophica bacterium]|nr:GIY-YIG nuclease family protein [Candidatus Omnitrophota bacterium]